MLALLEMLVWSGQVALKAQLVRERAQTADSPRVKIEVATLFIIQQLTI